MERVRLSESVVLRASSTIVITNFISLHDNVCILRILVPDYGVTPLHLIPMLVGFFTYKIGTFMLAIEEAITAATGKTQA